MPTLIRPPLIDVIRDAASTGAPGEVYTARRGGANLSIQIPVPRADGRAPVAAVTVHRG